MGDADDVAGASVRERYPVGVPCWIELEVDDAAAATRFYGGTFGWSFDERAAAPGGRRLVAQLGGADVAAISTPAAGTGGAPSWCTLVSVDDADRAVAAVVAAGGCVLAAPVELAGQGRTARCADPAGARYGMWEPRGSAGAQVVNAPGTWNWSDLATPDVAGAAAFYGQVFGWETRAVEMGPETATMWRVPGYGDFLATIDPDLRRRHAEGGVPPGFSDAIGWVASPTDGTDSARWGVTFAVDGTDVVVERAVARGGEVVTAPFDAGPTRIAVLRDPLGAVLTVSTYAPG